MEQSKFELAKAAFSEGVKCVEAGRYAEAEQRFRESLHFLPDRLSTLNNLCSVLIHLGRIDEALELNERMLLIEPTNERAKATKAALSQNWSEAITHLESTRSKGELDLEGTLLLARCYFARGDFEASLRILETKWSTPTLPIEAFLLRGVSFESLAMYEQAIATYELAIDRGLASPDLYNNLGTVESNRGNFQRALEYFNQAIASAPNDPQYYLNRARAKKEVKDYSGAEKDLEKVLESESIRIKGIEWIIELRRALCDWKDVTELQTILHKKLETATLSTHPYTFLITEDDPHCIQKAAISYAKRFPSRERVKKREQSYYSSNRIRLGYFSSDLNGHAIGHLTASLFELHDKNRFEINIFDFASEVRDPLSARIRRATEHYHPLLNLSDLEIDELCYAKGIQVAIDLNGFTKGARTALFASRVAPVQVNFLGYPGTLGANFYDYIVADLNLIPESLQSAYTEKVLYLPDTYQPNQPYRKHVGRTHTRSEERLPTDAFVYCNFNNNFKITPLIFAKWMKILQQVPKSVLWLLEDNEIAKENILATTRQYGISKERVIFAKRVGIDEHIARHVIADLFLDTFPYNAHTTASDALRSGLPIVTKRGSSFASRVAASLMTAAGIPECITNSDQEYVNLAVHFAENPSALQAIKQKLQSGLSSCPLFDARRYVRNLESGYTSIWRRHLAGLSPEHIYV